MSQTRTSTKAGGKAPPRRAVTPANHDTTAGDPEKAGSPDGALLWRKKRVAAALSIDERTVERLVSSGQFPRPLKIGRICCWEASTVMAWIASRRIQP